MINKVIVFCMTFRKVGNILLSTINIHIMLLP